LNASSASCKFNYLFSPPPDGAPEPDASVIRGTPRDYAGRLPGKGDVFAVIEVAHGSLGRDRYDKLPIYAGAGVPQYLIINVVNNTIEVFEDPDPGPEDYRTKSTVDGGQRIRLKVGDQEVFEFDAAAVLP
jgi:Uma2 family endonuclease